MCVKSGHVLSWCYQSQPVSGSINEIEVENAQEEILITLGNELYVKLMCSRCVVVLLFCHGKNEQPKRSSLAMYSTCTCTVHMYTYCIKKLLYVYMY